MSAKLPSPLAAFFRAFNAQDVKAVVALFTPDAVVVDEGREHRGRAAVTTWCQRVMTAYQPQAEVREIADAGKEIVVGVQVSGTFPGSPIHLHYAFTLKGTRIAAFASRN